MCAHSVVSDSVTPWTAVHLTLPSMGPPDKSTRVGCHFLLQGIFPEIKPMSLKSSALAGRFFSTASPGKPFITLNTHTHTHTHSLSKLLLYFFHLMFPIFHIIKYFLHCFFCNSEWNFIDWIYYITLVSMLWHQVFPVFPPYMLHWTFLYITMNTCIFPLHNFLKVMCEWLYTICGFFFVFVLNSITTCCPNSLSQSAVVRATNK